MITRFLGHEQKLSAVVTVPGAGATSEFTRLAHSEKPPCVGVQAVLDLMEAFLDRFPDRFRFSSGKYFASIRKATESMSSIFKEGGEVCFDITHRTVVLVDKGSPFLFRQRHRDSRTNSVLPEWRRPYSSCLYM